MDHKNFDKKFRVEIVFQIKILLWAEFLVQIFVIIWFLGQIKYIYSYCNGVAKVGRSIITVSFLPFSIYHSCVKTVKKGQPLCLVGDSMV